MQSILVLLPAVMQLVPVVETGVVQLIGLIEGIRTAAQQTTEWTPELEANFIAMLLATAKRPEQQPD